MVLHCGAGENSSLLDCKEIKPVNPKGNQSWIFISKDWCWSWNSMFLEGWCEEMTHWKRPWCWKRLKAGREGDDREWDGWMASLIQWTWVRVNSSSWWWTGRPSVLQSMESQKVRQYWVSNWTECSAFTASSFRMEIAQLESHRLH